MMKINRLDLHLAEYSSLNAQGKFIPITSIRTQVGIISRHKDQLEALLPKIQELYKSGKLLKILEKHLPNRKCDIYSLDKIKIMRL